MELSNSKYHCAKCAHEFTSKEAKQEADTIGVTVDLPGRSWASNTNVIHLVCPKCHTIASTLSSFGLGVKSRV